ncbi:hypothetical protein [Janthinobacterium sp. MDB2-8]|uniref:hypothetical protein n=1 Tax=Janthinobacterium sp. MDB2-8 TaxID=1259338 RepID=UPI003F240CD6
MMNDFLFADFLEDQAVYAAVEVYWQARLAFLDGLCAPYLRTAFANGQPFHDGNPIVNLADRNAGKAARIVQQCPCEFGHDYTSFEQAIELADDDGHRPAREKIIVLTLTQAAAQRAEAELRAWFMPDQAIT